MKIIMSGRTIYERSQGHNQTEGPESVTSAEVKIISAHSCRITWTPLKKSSLPIRGYYVEQLRLDKLEWIRINQIASETSFYLVSRLIPGEKYKFRIITEDIKGGVSQGKETDIIEPLGPGVVTAPEVKIINADSCLIGWTPPNKGSLPIGGYYVEQYRLNSFGWIRINQVATESTIYLVSGLTAGRKYRFRVITEDTKGSISEGKETDVIETVGRPDPPSGLCVYDITNRSCFLEWSPPVWDGGTTVTKYLIEKQKGYFSPLEECDEVDGSTYAKRIDGLATNKRHTFQIKAVNKVGKSCPSPVSQIIVTSGNDIKDDHYLTGLDDEELENFGLQCVSESFNRGLDNISSVVNTIQAQSPCISYWAEQKLSAKIQTLSSVAYSNILDAREKIETLTTESNRRIENLARDQGQKESELRDKETEIKKIDVEIKALKLKLQDLRLEKLKTESDFFKAEDQLKSAEVQLQKQKIKQERLAVLGIIGAVSAGVLFTPVAGLVIGGLSLAGCKSIDEVIKRAKEICDVALRNRDRQRERVERTKENISAANEDLTHRNTERDTIKKEIEHLKNKIESLRQKLTRQSDISFNMKRCCTFIFTTAGRAEILHDQTRFLYHPDNLLGPIRELTSHLSLPNASRLGCLLSGNKIEKMLVKVKMLADADDKWKKTDLPEHVKDQQIFMGSKSGKYVIKIISDIDIIAGTNFNQRDSFEDENMIMSSYADWGQLLSPAPTAVSFLGQFLLLSLKMDFPLNTTMPLDGFHYLRQPESFRASVLQIVNEIWTALNTAHGSMDQIRIYMQLLPGHITKAFDMISSASDDEIKSFLYLPLEAIQLTTDKSLQKARQAEEEFMSVVKMIAELQEALASVKGVYEGQKTKKKMTSEVAREEVRLVEEERKQLESQQQHFFESIKEAENQFEDATLSLPDGLNLFGMAVVDGIMSGFKATIDLLSKPLKKTKRQNSSNNSNTVPDKNQERLDVKIRQVHKQAIILRNIVNCLTACFVEEGKLNIKEIQSSTKVAYCEAQLNFIIKRLQNVDNCSAKKEMCLFCESVIKICQRLEKEQNSFQSDKNNTGDTAGELLLVQQSINSFVDKLKISVDSVEERKSQSRNSWLLKNASGKGVVKYELSKAQTKVEQTCAQLEYAQARCDEVCRTIHETNTWHSVLLGAIARLDMETLRVDDIIDLLGRSMKVLAELRQPWGKIVHFIGTISNVIKCTLDVTSRQFVDYAKAVPKSRVEGYSVTHLKRELLYQQVVLVSEIAQFIAILAGSYTAVSTEHLLPITESLPLLLKFDPKTQKDELRLHSQKLKTTCEAAQQSISRMLEQKKREFDKAVAARIAVLQHTKNQQLAEIERNVKQTSDAFVWDTTKLNPDDFV